MISVLPAADTDSSHKQYNFYIIFRDIIYSSTLNTTLEEALALFFQYYCTYKSTSSTVF